MLTLEWEMQEPTHRLEVRSEVDQPLRGPPEPVVGLETQASSLLCVDLAREWQIGQPDWAFAL